MAAAEERTWVAKLSVEEARELLSLLGEGHSSDKGIVKLRAHLIRILPEKVILDEYKPVIEEWGAGITAKHKSLMIRRWIYGLSEQEVKDHLESQDIRTSGSVMDMRGRLNRFVSALTGECHDYYVQLAEPYMEQLMFNALQAEDSTLDSQREEPGLDLSKQESPPVEDDADDAAEEEEYNGPRYSPIPRSTNPDRNVMSQLDKGILMDRVRKWGLRFCGSKKPQDARLFY